MEISRVTAAPAPNYSSAPAAADEPAESAVPARDQGYTSSDTIDVGSQEEGSPSLADAADGNEAPETPEAADAPEAAETPEAPEAGEAAEAPEAAEPEEAHDDRVEALKGEPERESEEEADEDESDEDESEEEDGDLEARERRRANAAIEKRIAMGQLRRQSKDRKPELGLAPQLSVAFDIAQLLDIHARSIMPTPTRDAERSRKR